MNAVIRKLYTIKRHIMLRYNQWRYNWLFDCFDSIDKYYDHSNMKDAVLHIRKWAHFRKHDSKMCEKYRQESIRLKMLLISCDIPEEALDDAINSDIIFGIDPLSSLVPDDFGNKIIDCIVKSNLVKSDEKDLLVWSANAPTQIRMYILDELFYQKTNGL